jgi:NTP pyrophosphatase (non-canonical NTP hydrolase)
MELIEKVFTVAKAQSNRFPEGDYPFNIVSRLLEEGGEVAWELNHYARKGISIDRFNPDGKRELVYETYQVMIALCQLMQYFNLEDDLKKRMDEVHQEYLNKGYL